MKTLRFSLHREEIPVILMTEDGTEKAYILREMSGRDRDAYLTKMGGKFKFNTKGKVIGVKSFDGLQAALLAKCLFDEDDKLVHIDKIQGFPTITQGKLFKEAQTLNALEDDEEENSKKDSGESEETGSN